ncbi:MAG: hypothetical protein C0417_10470 [Chlorobiaceae bacterium]|nr:hypothetical protein [Chlorobiaceae bacterium]
MIKRVSVKYLFLMLFCGWLFILSGCDNKPKPTDAVSDEAYMLLEDINALKSEYATYYLTPSEERKIFVFGKRPPANPKYTKVQVNGKYGEFQNGFTLKNDKNSYLNEETNQFTAPLKISSYTQSTAGDLETYNFSLRKDDNTGNVDRSFNVEIIEKREFAINYCYSPSYNVFDYGKDLLNDIKECFKDCNTEISLNLGSPLNSNLPEYFSFNIDNPEGLKQFTDFNDQYRTADLHYGTLYSMRNIKFYDKDNKEILPPTSNWEKMLGNSIGVASWIYIDRIDKSTRIGDDKKWLFNTTVLHELEHLRTGDDSSTHTKHNGLNKSKCIMTDPATTDIIRSRHFCEGHLQSLLDQTW